MYNSWTESGEGALVSQLRHGFSNVTDSPPATCTGAETSMRLLSNIPSKVLAHLPTKTTLVCLGKGRLRPSPFNKKIKFWGKTWYAWYKVAYWGLVQLRLAST